MLTDQHQNPVWLYILEVLSACLICYFLNVSFPSYHLVWGLIYIPLVISPIREKSRSLVFSRIKANFIGAFVGFCMMINTNPSFPVFCVGAVTIIVVCNMMRMLETARSALLSLGSVLLPHYAEPNTVIAVHRILSVTCGCLIALLVIVCFDSIMNRFSDRRHEDG